MQLNLENIDRIHPVVLKEIGAAMQRIAEQMGCVKAATEGDTLEQSLKEFSDENKPAESPIMTELKADLIKDATAVTTNVGRTVLPEVPILETPEQVVELLGEGSNVAAIAKDLVGIDYAAVEAAVATEHLPPHELDAETGTVITTPGEPAPVMPDLPLDTELYVLPAVVLDTAGLPWDDRIHAGTKTHVKDGTWKFKPRTSEELKAEVTAELRETYPAPEKPVVVTDNEGHLLPTAAEAFGGATPQAAAPAAPQAAAPAAPTIVEYTFVHVLEDLSTAVVAGDVTQEAVDVLSSVLFERAGVTGWPDLFVSKTINPVEFRTGFNDLLGAKF